MTPPSDLGTVGAQRDVGRPVLRAVTTAPLTVAGGRDHLELPATADAADAAADRLRIAPSQWLGIAESWHSAQRHPGPVAMDTVVTAAVVALVTASSRAALTGAAVFMVSGLALGLWLRRTCVEAQGVSWYGRRLLPAALVTAAALGALRPRGVPTGQAWGAVAAGSAALFILHFLLWLGIAGARRHGHGLRPTLVVGSQDHVAQFRRRLDKFPEAGLRFRAAHVSTSGQPAIGGGGQALVDRLLGDHEIGHVLLAADGMDERLMRSFVRFSGGRADASVVIPLGGLCAAQVATRLGDLGLLPVRLATPTGSATAKRLVDVVGASLLLLVTSPLLLAVALGIRMSDGGAAIFRQERVGREGRVFTMYKFRSMVVGAEGRRPAHLGANVNDGLLFKLECDPRVTRVGAFIRRLSIDELPQLVNVVKGDMSLVGPRPLPVTPDEFEPGAQVRHSVLPGITGLWQVSGGNALRYGDMLDLDLTYVLTRSLGTDLRLIARTVPALLVRRAAY
ncbi:MAG TPA: sugar transferase [Acidimicrobiales bacterium]|jgi:lipopolysaccharide/colanic/teichoic acid biosynthesis glycosyltransferase|nr:sugar transferase [Acidimicrobiales bacterium]